MYVSSELLEFLDFLLIGVLISFIFDFFRAFRRVRKVSFIVVAVQDIIYFLIITVILIFSIIFLLNTSIRLYIFLAVLSGILIYATFFSKHIIKFYMKIFKMTRRIFVFLAMPLKLTVQILIKIYNFFKKYIKKCCKMFRSMILIVCKRLNNIFIKLFSRKNNNKRGLKV